MYAAGEAGLRPRVSILLPAASSTPKGPLCFPWGGSVGEAFVCGEDPQAQGARQRPWGESDGERLSFQTAQQSPSESAVPCGAPWCPVAFLLPGRPCTTPGLPGRPVLLLLQPLVCRVGLEDLSLMGPASLLLCSLAPGRPLPCGEEQLAAVGVCGVPSSFSSVSLSLAQPLDSRSP